MADSFIGEIALFAFGRIPKNWVICDGRLMPIQQFAALYSLIGTQFGGDGRTNFAIPDLRGRAIVCADDVRGSSSGKYPIGYIGGTESVTLTTANYPTVMHTHTIYGDSQPGTLSAPTANIPASAVSRVPESGSNLSVYVPANINLDAPLHPDTIGMAGGSPHSNMQSSIVLNYCINIFGIYPCRT